MIFFIGQNEVDKFKNMSMKRAEIGKDASNPNWGEKCGEPNYFDIIIVLEKTF